MVITIGLTFRSKWFEGLVEVLDIFPEQNQLSVKITRSAEHYLTETWNLQHTRLGFDRMDYWREPEPIIL